MASPIASLGIEIFANIAGFQSDLKRVERDVKGLSDNIETGITRAAKAIGVSLGLAIVGVGTAVRSAIGDMDKLGDSAKRLSLGTEALSSLGYAAEQSGSSFEQLEGGLTKLSRSMAEAIDGSEKQRAAFAAVGVSIDDLREKNAAEIFAQVSDSFAKTTDGASEVQIAMALMGKSAANLIPLMQEGSAGIKELTDEARALGVVLGEGTVAQAQEFSDNVDKLRSAAKGAANDIAAQLLPVLVEMTDDLVAFLKEARETGSIRQFAEAVVALARSLDDLAVSMAVFFGVRGLASFATLASAAATQIGAMGAAAAIARGALAALGGPIGVLATVVAGAVFAGEKLADNIERQREVANGADAALRDLQDTLANLGAGGAAPRVAEITAQIDAARRAAIELDQLINQRQAFLGQAESGDAHGQGVVAPRVRAEVEALTATYNGLVRSIVELTGRRKDLAVVEEQNTENANAQLRANASAQQTIDSLSKQIDGIKKQRAEMEGGAAAAARLAVESLNLAGADAALVAQVKKLGQELVGQAAALDRARGAEKLATDAARLRREEIERELDRMQEVNEARATAVKAGKDYLLFLEDMEAQLAGPMAVALLEHTRQLEANAKQFEDGNILARDAARGEELLGKAFAKTTAEIKAQKTATQQLIDDLDFELSLIGKTNIQIAVANALRYAGAAATDVEREAIAAKAAALEIANEQERTMLNLQGSLISALNGMTGELQDGEGGWNAFGKAALNALRSIMPELEKVLAAGGSFADLFKGERGAELIGAFGQTIAAASGGGTAGALIGGASSAYAGYLAATATAGGPPGWVLAAIGAIVGAYAGYGGGDKDPVLTAGTRSTGTRTEASLQGPLGAILVGTQDMTSPTSRQVAEAIQDFDRTIVDLLNGAEEGLARTALANWQFRGNGGEADIGSALESRLEVIAASVLGPVVGSFIQNFSNDFQTQLQAFGDIIAIDRMTDRGDGLTSSLESTVALIGELGNAGESVGDTFSRLVAGVTLLDEALQLSGVTLDMTREGVVRFATQIAEAAGGLERASDLWNTYFDTFFTAEERANNRITQANAGLIAEAADIGIDPATTAEVFRDLFEAAFDSLSASEVVEWLEFGAAIAESQEAAAELAEILGTVTTVGGTAAEEAERLAEAYALQAERMAEISEILGEAAWEDYLAGLNDYDRQVAEINREWDDRRDRLVELGATTEQLAQLEGYRANELLRLAESLEEVGEAIATLTFISGGQQVISNWMRLQEIMQEVARVMGSNGGVIAQLEALRLKWGDLFGEAQTLGATEGQLALIRTAATVEARTLIEAERDRLLALTQNGSEFQQWLDRQLLSDTTTLTPLQQVEEARRQFDAAIASGASAGEITGIADQLLSLGREFFASGDGFDELSGYVRSSIAALAASETVDQELLATLARMNTLLDQIASYGLLNLPTNSYAVGSRYIPYDQVAMVHQGEMVVDSASAAVMRKYGSGGGDGGLVVRELLQRMAERDMKDDRRDERFVGALEDLKQTLRR